MATQVLKDKHGHKIGEIRPESAGRLSIYDGHGHRLGEYDPKTNTTKDARGHVVGTGNLLTSLL